HDRLHELQQFHTSQRGILTRWVNRITRWWLHAELTTLDRILKSMEESGETEVTAELFQSYIRRQLVEQLSRLINAQLRQFNLAAAAMVFLLLTLPASFLYWLG